MNFLLVLPMDEERGGVVSVAENLAKYLQAHGHTVLFLHPGPAVLLKTRVTKQGFQGIELRLGFPFAAPRRLISAMAFPFLFPVVLLQLLWFLRRRRIHVVNLHYPVDRFFYLAICRSLLRFRLVTSIHGDDAFVIDRGPSRPKETVLARIQIVDSVIGSGCFTVGCLPTKTLGSVSASPRQDDFYP